MSATPNVQKVKTSGLSIGTKKNETPRRKAAASTQSLEEVKPPKIVKKKTEDGVIEVPVHAYSPELSTEFEEGLRSAESVKAFHKTMKAGPEFQPAFKEHCQRKRYEVQQGKTWKSRLLNALYIGAISAAAAVGVSAIQAKFPVTGEDQDLDLE